MCYKIKINNIESVIQKYRNVENTDLGETSSIEDNENEEKTDLENQELEGEVKNENNE